MDWISTASGSVPTKYANEFPKIFCVNGMTVIAIFLENLTLEPAPAMLDSIK